MTRVTPVACLIAMSCIYTSCTTSSKPISEHAPTEHVNLLALEQMTSWSTTEAQLVLVLVNQYNALGRFEQGHSYFLERAAATEGTPIHAVFTAAAGLFQIQNNKSVALPSRKGFVREGVAMLDAAVELDPGLPRFLRGVALTSMPASFDETERGKEDLEWVLANRALFPQGVWRAALNQLGRAEATLGDEAKANDLWALSGGGADLPTLTSSFTVDGQAGFRFQVPEVHSFDGGLHQAEGFDFSDIGVIETPEGWVVIDAATRPDNARAALAAVRAISPGDVHTVVLTHGHWDHVGGLSAVAQPGVAVVAGSHIEEELAALQVQDRHYSWFWGEEEISLEVGEHRSVSEPETLGLSRQIELIPVSGGETEQSLMVHVPDAGTLFVGDVMMPYLGEPFTEEGDPEALLSTLDTILALEPERVLHGHAPLTDFFHIGALPGLRLALGELVATTLDGIRTGVPMHQILRSNVVPDVLEQHPAAALPYLVMREGVIKRLYDNNTGYWASDREGMETLAPQDWARALDLLGGGERSYVKAVEKLLDSGEAALPLRIAEIGLVSHPDSEKLLDLRTRAFHRLRHLHSTSDAFRFIVYSQDADVPLTPLDPSQF